MYYTIDHIDHLTCFHFTGIWALTMVHQLIQILRCPWRKSTCWWDTSPFDVLRAVSSLATGWLGERDSFNAEFTPELRAFRWSGSQLYVVYPTLNVTCLSGTHSVHFSSTLAVDGDFLNRCHLISIHHKCVSTPVSLTWNFNKVNSINTLGWYCYSIVWKYASSF